MRQTVRRLGLCTALLLLCGVLLSAQAFAASKKKSLPSLKNAKITLEETEFTYDGQEHTPGVTVTYKGETLTEGTDYTVTYAKNTDAGKATVKVEGTGGYQGKAQKQFTIRRAENLVTAEDIVLAYSAEKREVALEAEQTGDAKLTFSSKASGVTATKSGTLRIKAGFTGIANLTVTAPATKNYKRGSCKVRLVVMPEQPAFTKVFSGSVKEAELAWQACGGSTGYEIEVAKRTDFSDAVTHKVSGKKKTALTLDMEKKAGNYFCRIRSVYAKEKKTICASDWSEPQAMDVPLAVVMTASDYQKNENVNPKYIFPVLLGAFENAHITPSLVLFCGDYSHMGGNNYGASVVGILEEITVYLEDFFYGFNPRQSLLFVQGNHDTDEGDFAEDGLHDYGSCLVYVMNTQTANPFSQGEYGLQAEQTVIASAGRLKLCLDGLIQRGERRPVFIATHVPLHFSQWTASGGDNLYQRHFFDVLSEAGEQLNLVFLYGHNHGGHGDSSMGGGSTFLAPGDEILIPAPVQGETETNRYTREKLDFVYMNAGYTGYLVNNPAGTMSTCGYAMVYEDRVEFRRMGWYKNEESGPASLSLKGIKTFERLPDDYLSEKRDSYTLYLN